MSKFEYRQAPVKYPITTIACEHCKKNVYNYISHDTYFQEGLNVAKLGGYHFLCANCIIEGINDHVVDQVIELDFLVLPQFIKAKYVDGQIIPVELEGVEMLHEIDNTRNEWKNKLAEGITVDENKGKEELQQEENKESEPGAKMIPGSETGELK